MTHIFDLFCFFFILGTIRRFLEQYKTEQIVLCLESYERGIYEVLAPLYFPRDQLEESSALWQLPKDIGGIYGEPQIPDRQIRIIHNPQHSVMIGGKSLPLVCLCVIRCFNIRYFNLKKKTLDSDKVSPALFFKVYESGVGIFAFV